MDETHGAPSTEVVPGSIVAEKYRVEQILGRGGMGLVVRARHLQLGEEVALKFLHAARAFDAANKERFLREARAAVRIRSEHVARVFDVGTLPTGEPFMVMELLEGSDLHRLSRQRGPLPVPEAVEYLLQACRAIAEAHQLGIVHRDLKPANLFLTTRADGTPLLKVLDFGISKSIDGADTSLTSTGDVLGSPLYMSPEQIRDARRVDPRSDIWALGTILYKLLAGVAPFAADTSAGTLARIIADPVPPLRNARADIPPAIEEAILRCLEKSPEKRFQRVDELARALGAGLVGASPQVIAAPSAQLVSPAEPPVLAPAEATASASSVTAERRGRGVQRSGLIAAVLLGGVIGVVGLVALVQTRAPAAGAPDRPLPASTPPASATPPAEPPPAPPPAAAPTPTQSASTTATPAAAPSPPPAPTSRAARPVPAPAPKKSHAYDDRL
jgi:serine/threonine-protein kinase